MDIVAFPSDFVAAFHLPLHRTMVPKRPWFVYEEDGMLVAGMIAALAATVLIFFAASQTPVRHDDLSKRPPRAVVNAAEEWKVWSHKPADE